MANDNQIGLEAVFDNQDFQKGIGDYNKSVADASSETDSASTFMSDAWIGLSAVGQAAFSAIAAGIGAMVTELYFAVDAALDAEEAMARVNFIVDSVADRTGVTSEEVDALATSLSQVLPIDDEVIAQAVAMGLTFDGVNQDNIQPLLSAAADLAAFTGKDLPSAMKDLSLSITDPDRAIRLFREANITLTDAQKKTLKRLDETGDAAGATQFILEQLAQKGIIGLGEAMGQTAKGKFTIMETAIGNLQEALGEGLLESLKGVFDRITAFAENPKTVAFFTDLGQKIGDFAETVLDSIPDIMTVIEDLSNWFVQNKPIIVGVLAALGAALVAFGITTAASIAPIIASFAPLIIVIGLIGAAAALLYTAWTENWGGIQEQIAELWAALQPIFSSLQAWLAENLPIALAYLSDLWTTVLLPAIKEVFSWVVQNVIPILIHLANWLSENIPVALQYLSDLWTTTLLPALQAVWSWISTNLIPLFQSIIGWLATNIPIAISALSAFWTTTLLPALQAVWSWISTNLIPLFQAIANLMGTVVGIAITVLAGLWQNILLPAISAVWSAISSNLVPIFQTVASIVTTKVLPALRPLAEFFSGALKTAIDGISAAIQVVIGWINTLTEALANVQIPEALDPGSPTPFEIGLKGINNELKKMATATLPSVNHELNVLASVRDVPSAANGNAGRVVNNTSSVNNYLFGARFSVDSQTGLMEILSGLS